MKFTLSEGLDAMSPHLSEFLAFVAGMGVMAWTGTVVLWIGSRPWRRGR
jgi:hypothetical protein